MRERIIETIEKTKVLAIIRGVYGDDCLKLVKALYDGGVRAAEVTFDASKKDCDDITETIKALRKETEGSMYIGAGTVIEKRFFEKALSAGAQFIVSPDVNKVIIKKTVKAGLVSIAGAMTPTEILSAKRFGADFVKVFPCGTLGTGYFKAVSIPINNVKLLAMGGITLDNATEFLQVGAVGLGIRYLTDEKLIASKNFKQITENTKLLFEKISVGCEFVSK